ncbi:MAG: hypothetical protein ABH842_05225 [Candidatus Micrarchaeota archaeon]
MKQVVLFLFLICFAMASSPFFNQAPVDPAVEVVNQVDLMLGLIAPFMLMMIVLAAAAYVVGQIFGSETRAKASVWAQSMLVAVGICALIIFLIYAVLPGFLSGQPLSFDLALKVAEIRNLAETGFGLLILLMIVLAAAAYVVGQIFGSETRAKASVWANNLLAASIFASALYLVIFNLIIPFQSTLFTQPLVGGITLGLYGTLIIDVSILVSVIILVTYLISRFFKISEWEAYLNIELSNLMSSFVIFLFIVGMFATTELIASSFYDSSLYSNAPQAAVHFMSSTVSDSALKATLDIYKIQACSSMLSTFSKRTGEFVLTQTFKVFPGVDTFVSIANVLTYTLISFYSAVSVQIAVLHVVEALMVPFFLPAGLLLRFFPPTRDAGAFLISLAFGFQLIYPTLYLINAEIFSTVGGEVYDTPQLLIQSICGPFKYGAAGFLFNPAANPLFRIPGLSSLGTLLGKIVSEGLLNAISMAEFIPVLKSIAALSLLVLFMPALALMVTISFINVMTKFIVNKG